MRRSTARQPSTPSSWFGAEVGAVAVITCLAGLLAGCAGTRTSQTPVAATPTRDRVTQSDESDASKRARVRMELASAYFSRGQMTTALDQVKLAIVADPNVAGAYNLRGLIYANLADHQLAEESFRRALQIDARDADTMQNFGFYLCQQKRYAEANAMFEQALGVPQYQDSARTLLTQGVCHAFAGQLAESERTLTRAYEVDPANPATAVNLSEVLYRRGDYERARFHVRRVNALPAVANAQTLWLGARIENRLGNRQGVQEFGHQLRNRFPESREWISFQKGAFDE